jgi:small multidrug resistance pump
MFVYLTLLTAILAEVVATSALKASYGFTKIVPGGIAVVGYCIAFYSLSLTLRGMSLGIVYAIWSGVGIVLLSAVDWIIYKQKLDAAAMVGMGLIIGGVAIINLLSRAAVR